MHILYALAFTSLLYASGIAVPVAQLDDAVVSGFDNGAVTKFLGIPYAYPPTGQLRFRPTQELGPYERPINATAYGPACPQQGTSSSSFSDLPKNVASILNASPVFGNDAGVEESEDCLTINILRPSFVGAGDKFPVVVWIYGGAFQTGYTEQSDNLAVRIVQRSVELNQPVVFVHMNYRVSAFGFLGSKEIYDDGAGNLGLVDQRVALRWVNKYINQFGGDNSRVTLWGESAGAISVAMQMIAYGGDTADYFQAGFMQSGATLPVGSIVEGQVYYDFIVQQTKCQGSADTLDCLRGVEYSVLKDAVDATSSIAPYQSLLLAFVPRADGLVIRDDPHKLVQMGLVANIPIVSGNCDDEGTGFALSTLYIWTEDQFRQYISDAWLTKASAEELEPLWSLYPATPSDGSPFDTGDDNSITPQYKRNAAFQGDAIFQAPRRFFLQNLSEKQKIWSFLSKRLKSSSFLGSFHTSDLVVNLTDDYLVNFVNKYNPNTESDPAWPEYTIESPQLYTFPDSGPPNITLDNYRPEQFEFLTNISLKYPI